MKIVVVFENFAAEIKDRSTVDRNHVDYSNINNYPYDNMRYFFLLNLYKINLNAGKAVTLSNSH
jgi:hypothetical protein